MGKLYFSIQIKILIKILLIFGKKHVSLHLIFNVIGSESCDRWIHIGTGYNASFRYSQSVLYADNNNQYKNNLKTWN